MEILLAKRKAMKIKIYQEKGHHLPHIHIDYKKEHHNASYAIESGNRIEGSLPKQYDCDVSRWLERNRDNLLRIWTAVQNGDSHHELVALLAGDD
jgi:hypothetical protein